MVDFNFDLVNTQIPQASPKTSFASSVLRRFGVNRR